jgi:hypothetical protein
MVSLSNHVISCLRVSDVSAGAVSIISDYLDRDRRRE